MKRIMIPLIFGLLLVSSPINAKEEYWHDQDRYIVEMDGEGDATVLAYISLQNIGTDSISSITLEIPNERSIVHYIAEEGYYPVRFGGINIIDSYEMERLSDSILLNINLTTPIQENGRRSLSIVYTTPDVAEKDIMERFHVEFKTIKDSRSFIRDVSVSLSPPPDYYLKGFEGEVEYKPSFVLRSLQAGEMEAAKRGIEYIRHTEGKHFRNLDPGESAIVTGIYSKYWWSLYYFELVAAIGVAFLLFFVIHFYAKGRR